MLQKCVWHRKSGRDPPPPPKFSSVLHAHYVLAPPVLKLVYAPCKVHVASVKYAWACLLHRILWYNQLLVLVAVQHLLQSYCRVLVKLLKKTQTIFWSRYWIRLFYIAWIILLCTISVVDVKTLCHFTFMLGSLKHCDKCWHQLQLCQGQCTSPLIAIFLFIFSFAKLLLAIKLVVKLK